jgi:hypothetical protein
MITGVKQYPFWTFQQALKKQEEIKEHTFIQPDILRVQDKGQSFFLVVEQPRKTTEVEIDKENWFR